MSLALAAGMFRFAQGLYTADREAERRRRVLNEETRRLKAAHAFEIGDASAAAGGMGVEVESPGLQTYINAMKQEYGRQEKWAFEAGQEEIENDLSASRWGALADFGGSLVSFGQRNNWFRK